MHFFSLSLAAAPEQIGGHRNRLALVGRPTIWAHCSAAAHSLFLCVCAKFQFSTRFSTKSVQLPTIVERHRLISNLNTLLAVGSKTAVSAVAALCPNSGCALICNSIHKLTHVSAHFAVPYSPAARYIAKQNQIFSHFESCPRRPEAGVVQFLHKTSSDMYVSDAHPLTYTFTLHYTPRTRARFRTRTQNSVFLFFVFSRCNPVFSLYLLYN